MAADAAETLALPVIGSCAQRAPSLDGQCLARVGELQVMMAEVVLCVEGLQAHLAFALAQLSRKGLAPCRRFELSADPLGLGNDSSAAPAGCDGSAAGERETAFEAGVRSMLRRQNEVLARQDTEMQFLQQTVDALLGELHFLHRKPGAPLSVATARANAEAASQSLSPESTRDWQPRTCPLGSSTPNRVEELEFHSPSAPQLVHLQELEESSPSAPQLLDLTTLSATDRFGSANQTGNATTTSGEENIQTSGVDQNAENGAVTAVPSLSPTDWQQRRRSGLTQAEWQEQRLARPSDLSPHSVESDLQE